MGHVGPCGAASLGDSHGDGFQGGEAGALLADVIADTTGVPMLRTEEGPDPTLLQGEDAGHVGTPHYVRLFRCDRVLVQLRLTRRPPTGRVEVRLALEPKDALAGRADTVEHLEPGPHLAVTLPREGRGLQIAADEGKELLVFELGLRVALLGLQPLAARVVVDVSECSRSSGGRRRPGRCARHRRCVRPKGVWPLIASTFPGAKGCLAGGSAP